MLRFQQSRWLAPYIEKNSTLRAAAKNDFEKEFFKLMNNSIYGKTCENQKKRTDIKLITNEKKCKKLVEKPHCMGFKIFDEQLVGVEMRKIKTLINKPFYVGFSVLELSKLHMYRFHYDYFMKKYPAAKMLFTDTDSLMYWVETADIYKELFVEREHFDSREPIVPVHSTILTHCFVLLQNLQQSLSVITITVWNRNHDPSPNPYSHHRINSR